MSRFLLLNMEDFNLNQDITKSVQSLQSLDPFCICCLDREGPLFDLEKCNHSDYLNGLMNSEHRLSDSELKQFNQLVCTSCHSILKKIQRFQAQVIESFSILLSGVFTDTTENSKKLNNLVIQNVVDDLHLPPDIEIQDTLLGIESGTDDFINEQNNPNIEQNFTHDITGVRDDSNIEQCFAHNMADVENCPISNSTLNSNMEPFDIEQNFIQDQNKLNNIKTALEILQRNNQSFVSLSGQLQFLNGEYLSFLEPCLLSKEILTDIPVVPAKSMNTDLENGLTNNSKIEIEIDGADKMFYDSLDLTPELTRKEANTSGKEKAVEIKKDVTKVKKVRKTPINSLMQSVRKITLSHEELDRDRVLQAQSDFYLKYKFRCETCIVSFSYKENLEDHIKRKHGQRQGDGVVCQICLQVINNTSNVTEHNYRHYTRFECLHCNKRYHTHDEAALHIAKHHSNKKRTLKKPLKRVKMNPCKA